MSGKEERPEDILLSYVKITTLLFDCDNTLVLSEELAFEACAGLINTICEERGVEARFSGETLIKEFVGQNFRGMLTTLQSKYSIEIAPDDMEKYVLMEEDAVIAKLKEFFKGDVVFSAATSLEKPTSKPDPAIYLHALKKLGRAAGETVAIEDSKSGTLSGTRAGIKVVGYVGPYADDKKAEMEQVLRDAGAVIVMRDWSEFPSVLEKIEAGSV
uniref:FCP1 homology domain-containing protein n=1 Tax=Bionectria ochroleuca TaxID=29856 RepID=A0A0B7KFA2_BIOOC